jgi:hypothetical protein
MPFVGVLLLPTWGIEVQRFPLLEEQGSWEIELLYCNNGYFTSLKNPYRELLLFAAQAGNTRKIIKVT